MGDSFVVKRRGEESQAWWCTEVVPAPGETRMEGHELGDDLHYMTSLRPAPATV